MLRLCTENNRSGLLEVFHILMAEYVFSFIVPLFAYILL